MNTSLKKLDDKMNATFKNERHATEASNGVFMAALRNSVDVDMFMADIENGAAFDVDAFSTAKNGNFADFMKTEYREMVAPLVNVTAGGNGGMASIGRGEFFVFFASNGKAQLLKSGCGDLMYSNGTTEEMKHNGGKINVANRAGKEVFADLMKKAKAAGMPTDWMPLRKKDKQTYDVKTINAMNAMFCNTVCGTEYTTMSDDELKLVMLETALKKSFDTANTLLVVNNDNDFVRFWNVGEAMEYYSQKVGVLSFEIRANQSNPVAFYCDL